MFLLFIIKECLHLAFALQESQFDQAFGDSNEMDAFNFNGKRDDRYVDLICLDSLVVLLESEVVM